jgi:hypothetical protein
VTPRDDDRDVRRPLSDRDADALLRGRAVAGEEGLTSFVSDLQSLSDDAAPAPSAALAAIFEGGLVPDLTASPSLPPAPRRRWWLVPVPLAVVLVGATMGAAGANALPGPAQRVVSDTVSSITPIHLPKPKAQPKPAPTPRQTPSQAPAAVVHESADPQQRPTPEPTPSDHDRRHGGSDGGGSSDGGRSDGLRPSTAPGQDDGHGKPSPASRPVEGDHNSEPSSHPSDSGDSSGRDSSGKSSGEG